MSRYVTDTHSLIWYLSQPKKLSIKVRRVFQKADQGQNQILIPSIVLIEAIFIGDRQRIPSTLVNRLFNFDEANDSAYRVVSLNKAIAVIARDFGPSAIPEMADRIIAATARHFDLPLLTSDSNIKKSKLIDVYE